MRKLILKTNYALGDIVLMTGAVRDLHRCYPGAFITDVRTPCGALWNYNPYLRHLDEDDPDVETVLCDLSLIDWSNKVPHHALDGFIDNLNQQLGLHIRCTEFKGDIHLSAEEKRARLQVHELAGQKIPFWIICAGGRHEITIKWWDSSRYQQVVDHFKGRIQFVQAGSASDHHPKLKETIDLRGKTTIRQLLQLVYHAQGVLCGVTGPMHLAAAVQVKTPSAGRRPCVVVAGGRESAHWEAYPGHQFIHTVGALPCCAKGGCWKIRTVPLGDGSPKDKPHQLCIDVKGDLPHCMDMISAEEVIRRIETYFVGGSLAYLTKAQARAGQRAVQRTAENAIDRSPLTLPNARYAGEQFIKNIPEHQSALKTQGIVICIDEGSQLAGAWVCIKMLRQLGCTLPIELWHWRLQELTGSLKQLLISLNVRCIDALSVRKNHPTHIGRGPALKPYALSYCSFKEVLLFDANTVPLINPAHMFTAPEFLKAGAMFWQAAPPRRIAPQTWHLCGLSPRAEPPIATDHMLIDKEKCWMALALWLWYHEHSEVYHEHTHGGEDMAHLAFRKLAAPFIIRSIRRHGLFRYAGKLAFQHRNDAPWSLFLPNGSIRGFRFEKDCRKYLAELRQHWWARSISSHRFTFDQARKRRASNRVKRSSRRLEGVEHNLHLASDRFTVLTLHDEKMASLGKFTAQVLRDYAERQTYGFIYYDQLIDPTRHPSWNKVLAVRNAMLKQKVGWVMWLDADAMVMNHTIRAETLIPKGRDLVFASDSNGLVAGIFMIRCCEWSLKFLDTVFFLGDVNHDPDGFGPKWEQNTIKHVLKNFAGFDKHIALLPKRCLNSDLGTFQPGDFILHLGLLANGDRERTFREAQALIVK